MINRSENGFLISQNFNRLKTKSAFLDSALESLYEKQEMARGNVFYNPLLVSLATSGDANSSKLIVGEARM